MPRAVECFKMDSTLRDVLLLLKTSLVKLKLIKYDYPFIKKQSN